MLGLVKCSCDLFLVPMRVQVSVLDYQSTQLKLLPILATAYCLHFTKDHLVRLLEACAWLCQHCST